MNLAPEILKMRDALLERISGKSLKEVAEIVNEILLNETNNINRLAALSARVQVLKDYTKKEYQRENISKLKSKNVALKDIKPKSNLENEDKSKQGADESWVRVEMLKSGIVNGVRFPEGVVIDVSKTDADALEKEGLAKIAEVLDNSKETTTKKTETATEINNEKSTEPAAAEEPKDEKSNEGDTPVEEKDAITAEPTAAEEPKDEKSNEGDTPVEAKKNKSAEATEEIEDNKKTKDVEKKILKKKSTKITEETIELTDPKAVAEALGLNEKMKKQEEEVEIEEEVDLESLEIGKVKK